MRWRRAATDPPARGWTPDFAVVERFIREVMPAVPGGRQLSADSTGHHALIRQAATERGLSTKVVDKTTYFHDGPLAVGAMTGWVPSLVTREALATCRSKARIKAMLTAAGVPTPAGVVLDPRQFDEALAHVQASTTPQVLKPTVGSGGAGITCGITNEGALRAAWDTAARASKPQAKFVLEDLAEGVDVRAFVVGGRVVAAATRIHPHVVGDGSRSIVELVDEKQRWRAQHGYLRMRPIAVDTALLARAGRTIHDVPAADEIVVLNSLANVHVGGENVDVTEVIHPGIAALAVDAVRAIPGLGVAGIDVLAPDATSADRAVVLEANVGANIRIHHCPAYGQPRNVAGAIIDEMIATARRP
jgi:cyanophycin synthetase